MRIIRGMGSKYIGEVGGTVTLDVTCVSASIIDGPFGVSTLLKFRDGGGNVVAWFARGVRTDEYEPGRTYFLTGTVKAHKEFRGAQETHLSRVSPARQGAFDFDEVAEMEREIGDYPDPPEWHPGEKF